MKGISSTICVLVLLALMEWIVKCPDVVEMWCQRKLAKRFPLIWQHMRGTAPGISTLQKKMTTKVSNVSYENSVQLKGHCVRIMIHLEVSSQYGWPKYWTCGDLKATQTSPGFLKLSFFGLTSFVGKKAIISCSEGSTFYWRSC